MNRRVSLRGIQPGSGPMLKLGLALAGVAGILFSVAAGAAQIDVGTGTGCEAATIQGALGIAAFNGAGTADEIRITRTQTYTDVAIEISDWDVANEGALTLSGGWDSCTDTTASGRTVLSGDPAAAATVRVRGPNEASVVTLRRLELVNATLGLLAEGASDVAVESSWIRLNDGGVEVAGGADVELDVATEVVENSGASFGAGALCTGAGSQLVVAGDILDNTATNSGGGIHANTGCVVAFRAGALIEGNQANLGGGLFIAGGARAENLGTGSAGVDIYSNTAFQEGGGVYMAGTGPQTLLGNARIVSNEAGLRGGGVALIGGARLQLERFNFEQCLTPPRCVKVNENATTSGDFGSAVYADGGSELRMFQGYLESNNGPGFAGYAIYATGTGTSMLFEGIQIAHNSTVALFRAESGAEITAAFVSAAGNNYEVADGTTILDSHGGEATGAGAVIDLYSSILVDHQPFVTGTGGEIHGDCVLLDTVSGLTGHAGSMVGLDPHFVDVASGDLHLQRSSPAIDSCDAAIYAPIDSDADLDARGYDFTSEPDILGPYDRGFDEVRPLFADGFESGNTGAWSSAVP